MPKVLIPGYIFDLSFWQAALASTSFDEKKSTWVHFRSAPGSQVVPGFEPPSQKKSLSCCVRGKIFVEDRESCRKKPYPSTLNRGFRWGEMTRFVPGYAFETSPVGQKRTRVLSSNVGLMSTLRWAWAVVVVWSRRL